MRSRQPTRACSASLSKGKASSTWLSITSAKCPWTTRSWTTSTTLRWTSSASASSTRPKRHSATWPTITRSSATSRRGCRAPSRCRKPLFSLSRAKQMSETLVLGGAQTHPGGTLALGGGAEKPMLGRYRVEKELGKGAMGVVYLGKDPKIGRVVAIKTMALSQEFEVDELAEVKERFFREAETAGRLSHPNIVTIFDAGEEHDLCYIAMELLKGQDLVPFTKPGNTLPTDKVISIVARVADALGYAHKQNVVHRDVKPANVMYEPENDVVKVTDFGIARITDSSRTKTGMVLGTPSYMSPEQLQGKKIDGRSDLFSLAVSLYQLVCGKLPFEGDSMAQLMYRIANEHAPDILQYNPSLPPALVAFLDKAMAMDAGESCQTSEEFAGELGGTVGGPSATAIGAGVDISL